MTPSDSEPVQICEPKGGWRKVTERRTAVARTNAVVVDEAYPDEVVRLVLELGAQHLPCSIAQRSFKLLRRWRMAEIELSVFSRGCLNRRISDEPELRREVAALERERNAAKSAIDWRFTTQDARRKNLSDKIRLHGTSSARRPQPGCRLVERKDTVMERGLQFSKCRLRPAPGPPRT